jgi:hypothetical protein
MSKNLLWIACFIIFLSACISSRKNTNREYRGELNMNVADVSLTEGVHPDSLNNLPSTQYGGFVLAPGFYEAEFKTFCLQPGTPDPSPRDAYLQSSITGYRSDIIESVLLNSRKRSDLKQRNVQLLLWSVVSNSNYNSLSKDVRADAERLLTPKQVFELKGGWANVVRTVSNSLPSGNSDFKRILDLGSESYEKIEKIAVLPEPSQIHRPDYKLDQWYKQDEGYYVRYFPVTYKSVKMQVYVPDSLLDAEGKVNGDYLVFDPTGTQVIPANSNAQRLGVGGTVIDIIRKVIIINRQNKPEPEKVPEKKKEEKPPVRKKGEITIR